MAYRLPLESFVKFLNTFNKEIAIHELTEFHITELLVLITNNFEQMNNRDKLSFYISNIEYDCSKEVIIEKTINNLKEKELTREYRSIDAENKTEMVHLRFWLIKAFIVLVFIVGIFGFGLYALFTPNEKNAIVSGFSGTISTIIHLLF